MNDNIVPNDSKYIPLTQQRWLCVPTCIQMIMLKHNIPLLPAELIGSYMKFVVPEEDKFLFWNKNIQTGKKPKAGYGTQLSIGAGLFMNSVLKKLKVPLRMNRKLVDQFEDIEDFKKYLKELNFKELDVLVCFDSGVLMDKAPGQGHVCVLDKVDINKEEIRIINPSPSYPKWRIVSVEKLYQAMKVHGKDNGAGFWEFSLIK